MNWLRGFRTREDAHEKILYLFLILVILVSGIWILNSLNIISLKAWERVLLQIPPFKGICSDK